MNVTTSTSSVKVAVRVRPMAAKELLANSKDCVEIIPGMQQIIVGGGPSNQVGSDTIYNFTQKSFTFDYLFDDNSTQEDLYNMSVSGLVDRFLEGFNATILAYGQTGSGKTYSMGIGLDGITHGTGSDLRMKGIVPRAITAIFSRIAQLKQENDAYTAEVAVSFLELYNEELVDLLNPRPKSAASGPTIREDGNGKIVWVGLCDETVSSSAELLSVLQKGTLCRTTGSTDMNATSSRSHAIFTVTLRQSSSSTSGEGSVSKTNLTSKFHFVDLAGSERLKRTNAEGDRKKEGISINQGYYLGNLGLLALGNVISALGDETRRTGHVPYRDSKLTRMLQDSLGGNSQTLMLACISPSDLNYGETINTLHYANRARNIKNRVAINQDWGSSYGGEAQREIKSLRLTISKLRTEIAMIRAGGVEIKDVEQESHRNISALADQTKLQYHQRRERDHLAEIDALKAENSNSLFQLDRFHFLSIRLAKQVKKLMSDLALTSIERDRAVADKCRILNKYANEAASEARPTLVADGESVDIQDLESVSPPGKKLKGGEIAQSHAPKRSRSPVGVGADITPMIRHYLSTISQLRLQLSECEDKLAWQYEAMSKLGQKTSSNAFSWPVNTIKELNISSDLSANRVEELRSQADTSERSIVKGERKLMEAIRENIQISRNIGKNDFSMLSNDTEMSNLSHEISLESMQSVAKIEHDSELSSSKDEQGPDIYMLINKLQNDIVQHEALAESIQKREQEYNRMQKAYESKLSILQHEMEQTQQERDLALKKMGNGSKQQRYDVKTKYEEAQRRLDSEISDTRRKLGENSRMQSNSKSRAEKLTSELKATIAALKSRSNLILGEKMKMLQELRLQTQKHRDSTTANMREISKLRRKEKNASEVAKRLERSNQLQRLMLKKRNQEVVQTQQKLRSIMQNMRKSSTPTKISKNHVSGCTSPIPRLKSRNGRGQLTGSAMNELLASVNSPVRVSVSQSFTNRPDIDLRAQFKKQMVDKELFSTIQCRKSQKTLQNYKMLRNRLIEEQKELIAERKRVVEANFKATKIYDDKSPQYMDDRVQSIDLEIASIDSSMVELENSLKRHSGILESGYIGDEGSLAVDLNWENALNLLKSLDRNELEATLAYFLEDVVALRTLEDEFTQELDSKDQVVANLKQQLEDVQENFYKQINVKRGVHTVLEPSCDDEVSSDHTPVAHTKPLLPRIMQQLTVSRDLNECDDSLKAPTTIRIPALTKRNLMRPLSVSPSPSITEELDSLSFRSKTSIRPSSPLKEIARPLSAALPGLRLKDKDDTFKEDTLTSSNSMVIMPEDEPKSKKRYDLLTMGASGDVFQRLAHSHTQASQAKVISRSSVDKDSLMQDVSSQESKRKSLSEMEHSWHE